MAIHASSAVALRPLIPCADSQRLEAGVPRGGEGHDHARWTAQKAAPARPADRARVRASDVSRGGHARLAAA